MSFFNFCCLFVLGAVYQNYCSNVCAVYQRTPLEKEDNWPPIRKVNFINLAILKSEKLSLTDDYTLMTIQHSADDIVSKKKRIGYNELFDGLQSGARILIEGRPGCGKTTLMNKVSLDWAHKMILKDISLLLLVPLRRTFMMVGCVKEELQAMKEGLTDIIPSELLAGLTAEVS